ncbi:universal stress protein [Chitinophaga vietnamensis]|uniref:universal stress protein n=1 Tax=Chitinophaga vietnamensis TaxID=2593957 RepID=UPI00117763E0|nr:universal stress protein [Chitinophaga vietnamensis]
MQTILVLTDFSDAAFHAAEYAAFLAKHYKSRQLILLNSYFVNPTALAPEPVAVVGLPDLQKDSNDYLEQLRRNLSAITGPDVTIHYVSSELPVTDVVNVVGNEEQADVVVMGMKGKSNLEKVLIGSTAIRTMNTCELPLLLIPGDSSLALPKRAVLAVDLDNIEEAPKDQLLQLLDMLHLQLLVLNIANNDRYTPEVKDQIALLHQLLDKYQPAYHYDTDKDIAGTINDFAATHQADLIITLHKQKNSILSIFQKSISQKLAWNSTIPLLIFPR